MAPPFVSFFFVLVLVTFTFSYPLDHQDPIKRSTLSSKWYQRDDHPVKQLFRRQNTTLPAVGSDAWRAQYPTGPPEANIPQKWLQSLSKAVAAGLIPNIPVPQTGGGSPNYGAGNAVGPEICSAFYGCHAKGDIWEAPNGTIAISFDDGPVGTPTASPRLYDFLKQNSQKATHFMIGQNILFNPDMFLRAFSELDDDIAVHTWTHPHMSGLTNEQILAELGWTMQIIHDSTGGRIPSLWRPPYGDADNRVRAIASVIFGLTTVIWNRDSSDWNIGSGYTLDSVQGMMTGWLTGPKSPGLVILEHEITPDDATTFINAYPLMKSNNWNLVPVGQLLGDGWYQNSKDNTSPVDSSMDIIQYPPEPSTTSASTHSTSSNVVTTTANIANNQAKSSSPSLSVKHSLNFLVFLVLTFALGAYCP